jgi:hypothetical protein
MRLIVAALIATVIALGLVAPVGALGVPAGGPEIATGHQRLSLQ